MAAGRIHLWFQLATSAVYKVKFIALEILRLVLSKVFGLLTFGQLCVYQQRVNPEFA